MFPKADSGTANIPKKQKRERFSWQWKAKCALSYSSCAAEVMEERLWYRERREEFFLRHDANNFSLLCHFLMRQGGDMESRMAQNAEKAAAWGKYRLRVMASLCAVENGVSPAWFGAMGQISVETSWSLFAIGSRTDGYTYLERAFAWYERWLAIPDGTLLEVGDPAAFGGIKIEKGDFWNILLPNVGCFNVGRFNVGRFNVGESGGQTCQPEEEPCAMTKEWTPYGLLFMANRKDLHTALTASRGGGWYAGCEGFDAVRQEEKFQSFVKRAESMLE